MSLDLRRLDLEMDRLLAVQLRAERTRLREDGIDEDDIRDFCRAKIEQFRDAKEFALPAIVAAIVGKQAVPRSRLN